MACLAYPLADLKVHRLIANPQHATANGAVTSSRTHGSGNATTGLGTLDRQGYDFALILVTTGMFKSAASISWRIRHHSGVATLNASATSIASAIVTSSITGGSGRSWVLRLDLRDKKRYLNGWMRTCVTSGSPAINVILFNGNQFPPSFGSKFTVRNI